MTRIDRNSIFNFCTYFIEIYYALRVIESISLDCFARERLASRPTTGVYGVFSNGIDRARASTRRAFIVRTPWEGATTGVENGTTRFSAQLITPAVGW